jgi:hypothetical protein
MRILPIHCLLFLMHWGICSSLTSAQNNSEPIASIQIPGGQVAEEEQLERIFPNLQTPTMGGKQLWTDFQWRGGWRIQQNVLTKHWRLLDANNVRYAWGNRAACEAELNARQPNKLLPTTHAVVLMHGLGRSSASMKGLAKYLGDSGFGTTICLEYASSRDSISQHAAALREVIDGLPADVRLDFVGHSMGNIVVRHAIGDWQQSNASGVLNRIEHVVMLGPPNQGASIARQLARTGVFGWVAGEGALALGKKWEEFEKRLAIPTCPFGIVAGRLSENAISNPLVDGTGDFVVSIEETKLDGAADFIEVPVLHSFLMDSPDVQRAVASFLRSAKFESR